MKKIFAILISLLLIAEVAFALDVTLVDRQSNPILGGNSFSASTTIVDASWRQMALGTTAICSITFLPPIGTAYVGGADVKTTSIAVAATGPALTLYLSTTGGLYVTGPNGQKMNWIIVKP